MSTPDVISLRSATRPEGADYALTIQTPGARADDVVIVVVVAYGATPLDEGSGFHTNPGGVELEALSKTTVGDLDFIEQSFAIRLPTSRASVFVEVPDDLGPSTIMATGAVVRGALSPTTYPSTWYSEMETVTSSDIFGTLLTYDDPEVTVDDEQLILSVGIALSPSHDTVGYVLSPPAPDDAFVTETIQRPVGIGSGSAFYAARPWPLAGGAIAWTATPTLSTMEAVVSFGFARTLYLRSQPADLGPTYPTSPSPQRLRLTCAESYSAWITDITYENRVDRIGWSSLSWSRSLDEYSRASVSAPDELGGVYCVAKLGGLVPWKFGLILERNDQEVWKGPIRSVSRSPRAPGSAASVDIEAVDILGRYEKLPLIYGTPAVYEETDSGTVFRDVIVTHSATSTTWTLRVPKFNSGTTMSRTLRASDNQSAYEVLKEIMDSSADITVINGEIYAFDPERGWLRAAPNYDLVVDGPYNAAHEFVFGLFTAEAFSEMPGWSISGSGQGNYVAVAASAIGELGFSKVLTAQDVVSQAEYGVLLLRDQQSVQRADALMPVSEDETLIQRANSMLALHSREPAVVSGGALAEGAPVDVPHLIPGSIWNLDIHDNGYGQLLQQGRLKRVDVSVRQTDEGLIEDISPTLHPVGYEAGDG